MWSLPEAEDLFAIWNGLVQTDSCWTTEATNGFVEAAKIKNENKISEWDGISKARFSSAHLGNPGGCWEGLAASGLQILGQCQTPCCGEHDKTGSLKNDMNSKLSTTWLYPWETELSAMSSSARAAYLSSPEPVGRGGAETLPPNMKTPQCYPEYLYINITFFCIKELPLFKATCNYWN